MTPRMSPLESAYADNLEQRHWAGEVLWWGYKPVNLQVGGRTFYIPDFLVVVRENTASATRERIEFHIVNDFMEDDAVAAKMNPWASFRLVKRERTGGWKIVEPKGGNHGVLETGAWQGPGNI